MIKSTMCNHTLKCVICDRHSYFNYDTDLTAVVSMSDSGGSSGKLRDEFGILPTGDIRLCLIALSEEGEIWRDLFQYRFVGGVENHNLGNLIMTALTDIRGDFIGAVNQASKILKVKGKVIPVTLEKTTLCAELSDGSVIRGETNIDIPKHDLNLKIKKVYLEPKSFTYKEAISVIKNIGNDLIIIGPGDLYTSIIPNLLVEGIISTIKESNAKKVFICNIMTKNGETSNFSAKNFVEEIKNYLGFYPDIIICNNKSPSQELAESYKIEKSFFVSPDIDSNEDYQVIKTDLIDEAPYAIEEGKRRPLIRHDPQKLARAIMEIN